MNAYIEQKKGILGGALVIKGSRVPVSRIVFLLSRGKSIKSIIKANYPFLSELEVKKALEEASSRIK